MEIGPAIYQAIEIIKKCFGGIDVEIISDGMYRLPPDEYAKAGRLGVDIMMKPIDVNIEPVKAFLGYESMAEDIAWTPYGEMIANSFVWECLGDKMMTVIKNQL